MHHFAEPSLATGHHRDLIAARRQARMAAALRRRARARRLLDRAAALDVSAARALDQV